ncbi:SPOR domain-containing protein [Geminicoccus flavidas]|uniref:SPOR domain-containing protein n=1 Tax=Geminicoccus flavidas TaxID=2506407 RepID=UPI00135AA90B|nr:SPOR domain-containing protein [Geminicoccus flavidas]
MSDESFDAAQKALRNRAVVDLEEPLPDEQPTRWWLRILVLLVFFAFGAIVWLSWQDNAGDGTPVLVAAPDEPIKQRPDDPGGMDLRNDNTAIASALDPDGNRSDTQPQVGPVVDSRPPVRPVEEELPPSAEVSEATSEVAPDAAPQTAGAPPLVSIGDIIPTEDNGAGPEPAAGSPAADGPAAGEQVPPPSVMAVAPEPPATAPLVTAPLAPVPAPEPVPAPRAAPPATPAPSPAPAAAAGPMPVVPPAEPPAVVDTTPVPPPAPAAPPPAPPTVVATAPAAPEPAAPAARSGVRIQVASLRSEADANVAWDRAARKHPDVFAGKRRVITQAEVRGATYYRAQLEGFASRAEAQAACEALKSAGSDCLVVR